MIKKSLVAAMLFSMGSVAMASELPSRISCFQQDSSYQLVLILEDSQLPAGVTVIGLKDGDSVVFKAASQNASIDDHFLSLIEFPATETSKQVLLDLTTKVAKVSNFQISDLEDGAEFNCEF